MSFSRTKPYTMSKTKTESLSFPTSYITALAGVSSSPFSYPNLIEQMVVGDACIFYVLAVLIDFKRG